MKNDQIHVEPREVSELEFHAAIQAATYPNRELPDPLWPGHVLEEVKAPEPDCAAYRADKLRREAARVTAKKPARVPRDTEPCSLGCVVLWGVVVLAGMVGLSVGLHWVVDVVRRWWGL